MKVLIKQISDKANECLIIECVEITPDIESIRSYALAKSTTLTGSLDERIYQFNLSDVFYFEAVDERVFAYTKNNTYELKIRLYELENAYADKHFVRCSKSFLINLIKLESISPALNGRFTAYMKNGERIIISRQYVPELKRTVLGESKMDFKTFFVKKIMMSFFVSVTCISAIMALIGIIFEPDTRFGYEALLSPLIFGAAASLPLLVKYSKKELSLKQTACRNVLHFVLLEVVILSILYFGGALTDLSMTVSLGVSILIIDLTVNLVLWINDKKTAKIFNDALKRLQSDNSTGE